MSDVQQEPDSEPNTPWTYRVAQNPQFVWIPIAFLELALAAFFASSYFNGSSSGEISLLFGSAAFAGLAFIMLPVGGFTNIRSPKPLDSRIKSIPHQTLWILHIPLLAAFAGISIAYLIDYEDYLTESPIVDLRIYVLYAAAWLVLGCVLLSFAVAGHRRKLVFTPERLVYTRGWFRASIPWTSITDLRPVCDANIKKGGRGRVDVPSRYNLRAGVQLFVNDDVEIHRKTMLFRINDQNVIGVDCSSYKIDPNTLINAIYLLTENPELRPLLATPEGSDIFVGPSWNTRRKMRVGDTWDRRTNEIVSAADTPLMNGVDS